MRTMTETAGFETTTAAAAVDLDNRNAALLSDLCHFPLGGADGNDEEEQPEECVDPEADGRREEREERSAALERTYVYDVYEQIAPHFRESHHRPWPRVQQFLTELEPGSLVCDVGCGNGKYLDLNVDVFTLGVDRCQPLGEVAAERGHEVTAADNMSLPFRDDCFDAALSVAVVHHFATTERRVQALRELARVLRIGGRLMITVWALEQRHRKFESQDVLVPWHKPLRSSSEEQTSLDKEITSTTTSDDDILNYHAYTSGMESEPYFVPACFPRKKHRFREGWVRYRGKNLESCRSSSQSSSDLSSPNETCYSFVRRALQKLSSGGGGNKSWEDPHTRCRPPWFLQSADSIGSAGSRAVGCRGSMCSAADDKPDSLDSNENADDIPIELHDLDNEMFDDSEFERRRSSRGSGSGRSRQSSLAAEQAPVTATTTTSAAKKFLLRSTSTDSPQPAMVAAHKSKSLGDILSLFGVNFLQPRKNSLTTTDSSVSSATSLATKQSSTSSVSSATGRSISSGVHSTSAVSSVTRSKSTHLALAKVDEDNEQPSSGITANIRSSSERRCPADRHRWSVGGLPTPPPTLTEEPGRRPRSLVLGHEMRMPRTLSAEDHKNGNTILPDLDGCLSFYGLTTGPRKDENGLLSPPYTKVVDSHRSVQPPITCTTAEALCSAATVTVAPTAETFVAVIATNATDDVTKLTLDNNRKNARLMRTDRHRQHLQQCVSRSAVESVTNREPDADVVAKMEHTRTMESTSSDNFCVTSATTSSEIPGSSAGVTTASSLTKCADVWKDLFFSNLINFLIDREHLFPYRSMPNLSTGSRLVEGADDLTSYVTSYPMTPQDGDVLGAALSGKSSRQTERQLRRRFSQPCSLAHLHDLKSNIALYSGSQGGGLAETDKKFSADALQWKNGYHRRRLLPDDAGRCRIGPLVPPRNLQRPLLRRRSCICDRVTIRERRLRHSYSADDTALCRSPLTMDSVGRHCGGGHKIIAKEDSLQSDTSADSDDSVASVIVVQRDRVPSVDLGCSPPRSGGGREVVAGGCCGAGRSERFGSACSKDSSNHSDTSVESEESCISVIPNRQAGGTDNSDGDDGQLTVEGAQHPDTTEMEKEITNNECGQSDVAEGKNRQLSEEDGNSSFDDSECNLGSNNSGDLQYQVVHFEGDFEDVVTNLVSEVECVETTSYVKNVAAEINLEGVLFGENVQLDLGGQYINLECDFEDTKLNLKCVLQKKETNLEDDSLKRVSLPIGEFEHGRKIINVFGNQEKEKSNFENQEKNENDSDVDVNFDFQTAKYLHQRIESNILTSDSAEVSEQPCPLTNPLTECRFMDLKLMDGSFEDDDEDYVAGETMAKEDFLSETDFPYVEQIDELLDEDEQEVATYSERVDVCSSVSWEKYLDACESLVLDSIFYVNAGHSHYAEQHDSIADILPNFCSGYETATVHVHDILAPQTAETCWLDPTGSSSGATDSWKSSDSVPDEDASELDGLHSLSDDLLDDELRLDISHDPAPPPERPPANSPQGRLLEAAAGVASSLHSTVNVAMAGSMSPRKQVATTTLMTRPEVQVAELSESKWSFEDLDMGCDVDDLDDELVVKITLSDDDTDDDDEICAAREEMASDVDDEDVFHPRDDATIVMEKAAAIEYDVIGDAARVQGGSEEATQEESLQQQKRQVCEDMINGNIPGNRKLLKKMAQECGLSWAALKRVDGMNLGGGAESRSGSSCAGGSPRRKSDSEAIEPPRGGTSIASSSSGSVNNQSMCRGRSLEFSSLSFCTRNNAGGHHPLLQLGRGPPGNEVTGARRECAPIQYQIQEEEEMSRSNASSSDMTGSLESSFRMSDILTGEASVPQSPLATCTNTTTTTATTTVKMVTSPPCDVSMTSPVDSTRESLRVDVTPTVASAAGNAETDLMQTSMTSSIENHFGQLEFVTEREGGGGETTLNASRGRAGAVSADESVGNNGRSWRTTVVGGEEEGEQRDSLSISTSDDSILSGSENGGSATYHRYYHVFREGELDHLIDKYVENLHIISSYYDHSNWCIVAEKVQVWRI